MQEIVKQTQKLIESIDQYRSEIEAKIKAYRISETGNTWLSEESDILDGIVSHLNDLEAYLEDI